jgi:hypothetical protein
MIRHVTRFGLPVLVLVMVFLAGATIGQTDPTPKRAQPGVDKKAGKPTDQTRALLSLMYQEVDVKPLQAPHSLRESLQLLSDAVAAKGKELPIVIDVQAFKDENPEAPDIHETQIRFPTFPRRMTLVNALRLALAQVPTRNATFLIRGDVIEITTFTEASNERLLGKRVSLTFDRVRLRDALDKLSAETGLSVIVDNRVGPKADMSVTALFRNDVTMEAALRLLVDMADLKLLIISDVVYITTPTHAKTLMEEEAKRQGAQALPGGSPGFGLEGSPPLPQGGPPSFSPIIPRLVPLSERRKEAV